MRRNFGFTLIELLVVIAIIALLAAILFPVFGRARERARAASCLSNEKQLGMAMLQYTQDYDEYYPLNYFSNNAPTGWKPDGTSTYVQTALIPYIKNTQVLLCPSSGDQTKWAFTNHVIKLNGVNYYTDYIVNGFIMWRLDEWTSAAGWPVFPVMLSSVTAPATTIAIAEGNPNMSSVGSMFVQSNANSQWSITGGTGIAGSNMHEGAPHFDGMNAIFCDATPNGSTPPSTPIPAPAPRCGTRLTASPGAIA